MRLIIALFAVSTVAAGVATVLIGITTRDWFGADPLGEVLALVGGFTAWATYTVALPIWLEKSRGLQGMQRKES